LCGVKNMWKRQQKPILIVSLLGIMVAAPVRADEVITSPSGREPQTFRTTYGETLIIDLINTRLQLPSGDRFQQTDLGPRLLQWKWFNRIKIRCG